MLLNEAKRLTDFSPRQAGLLGDLNRRLKPELCLAILALNMDMHPRLFSGEEVEPEAAFTKYGWTHRRNDTR
ncbi:MAG: hypothetical protein Q8N33_13585 [Rhodocyclaceae bacterium]|nr:hypothetical protein [Rhodocyclaceae bacterium]